MIERKFGDITKLEVGPDAFDAGLLTGRAVEWTELLKSRRIMLFAEAGSGKTYECQARRKILWDAGEPAFFLELSELARQGPRDLLSSPEVLRLEEWRRQDTGIATFFLDSFDELKLSRGSFRSALVALERMVEGRLSRVRIIVTTRPIPFDQDTVRQVLPVPNEDETPKSEQFARIAMGLQEPKQSTPPDWRTVKLLPFTDAQVVQFAKLKGVNDTDGFLDDIRRRGMQEFSRRPLDLDELCASWISGVRSTTQHGDMAANVAVKLQPDNREAAGLSIERALEGASRLAIAVALTRKRSIRYVPNDDVSSAALALDPQLVLTGWTLAEQSTLLQRPMFSFASYGAVRFHHRSVQEYLAAECLGSLVCAGMTTKAAKRLLFGTTSQRETIVKPSMRPVAAWLAGTEQAIFDEIVKREPVILLTHGDPSSLSPKQRALALQAMIEQHGRGGWRGLDFPELQARRFATPELAPVIEKAWREGVENPELRDLLLSLIEFGKLSNCADLAYKAAIDPSRREIERFNAINALVAIEDPRLGTIAESIVAGGSSWPGRVARWAVLRIFPGHLDASALSRILPNLARIAGDDSDAWELRLADALADAVLGAGDLHLVRRAIANLLEIDPDPDKRWPLFEAKRPSLAPALAVVCGKLMAAADLDAEVLQDGVLSLRTHYDAYGDHRRQELRDQIDGFGPTMRRRLFEADDTLLRRLVPSRTLEDRIRDATNGPLRLGQRDLNWMLETIQDKNVDALLRSLSACVAIRLWEPPGSRGEFADSIKQHAADLPDAMEYLTRWAEAKPDETWARMIRNAEAREQERKAKQARHLQAWERFWQEVASHPESAFAPDRRDATVGNLWNAMNRTDGSTSGSEWNRTFIERQFNAGTANRLRQALMLLWRAQAPQLPCERPAGQRNEYPQRWLVALAGISAESEDPDWSKNLTAAEAEVASRFVPWHLNGFPPWLEGLARDRPAQVAAVLGRQLEFELAEPVADNWHSPMLHSIRHGGSAIAALFLPAALHWLEGQVAAGIAEPGHPLALHRVAQVLGILETHGDLATRQKVAEIAESQLSRSSRELALVWMRVLMRVKPDVAVRELEQRLATQPPAKDGEGISWIATLFGEASWHTGAEVQVRQLPSNLVVRLLRLAYRHVRVDDDVVHTGAYTPGTREHAERGRDALLSAALNATGPEGWKAKLELANDPMFVHMRARIAAVARERAAEEADAVAITEADLRALTRVTELPPATLSDMHMLLQDRLDDIEDMLLRDHSPREVWASIGLEHLMRREIARALDNNRRGAYTVDQEAVTADEKETDIRLRSPLGPQAVIELKVAEKGWSAAVLRDTISNQLVARYMAAEQCRSGCLLVTVADRTRMWNRPEGGQRMDVYELLVFLKAEARRVEEGLAGRIHIDVRILDLSPRLGS